MSQQRNSHQLKWISFAPRMRWVYWHIAGWLAVFYFTWFSRVLVEIEFRKKIPQNICIHVKFILCQLDKKLAYAFVHTPWECHNIGYTNINTQYEVLY